MKSAIKSAKRRGTFGKWRRRLIILGITALGVGAAYLMTIDRNASFQHMAAATAALIGLIVFTIDWWVGRSIKRSGGVQAMRSGGVLSTGPGATAGRLWAQGEGFRICGLHEDARKNFQEAHSLFIEAKDETGQILTKISQAQVAGETGEFQDADSILDQAINIANATKDGKSESRALLSKGNLALFRKSHEQARQAFEQSRQISARENDRMVEGNALLGLGEACCRLSLNDEAAGHFEQAGFVLSQVGDRIGEAHAMNCRGELNRSQRQDAEAQNRFERAISNYRRTGDLLGEGMVRIAIADVYRKMRHPNEAREMVMEGITRFKKAGQRVGVSELIAGRGDIKRARIRFDWARANGQIARNLFIESGERDSEARVQIGMGEMERLAGNLNEAKTLFERAAAQTKSGNDLLLTADAQKGKGHVELGMGQNRAAREVLKEAYGHYQNAGGARDAAQTLMDLGQIDLMMENPDRARVNFTQVRSMYQALRDPHGEATALRAIADLESALGRLPQAQQAYGEARILFQSVGDRLAEADCALLIGLLAVNVDNATATALLVQAGRLYRAVGAVEWQRRAHAMAQRVR